jgi:hypothetical protein
MRRVSKTVCEHDMSNFVKWLLKLLLTVGILGGIGWSLDVRSIVEILPSFSPYAVAAGFAFAGLQLAFSAGRLCLVVGLFDRRLKLRDSLQVTIQSLFFAQTFISFLGSDALRIWKIQRAGAPLPVAIEAVTLDRLTGVVVNHLLLVASLPWLLVVVTDGRLKTGLIVLAAAGMAGIGVILVLGLLQGRTGLTKKLAERFDGNRLIPFLAQLSTIGRHFLAPRWALLKAATLSLLVALMNSLIFFALLSGWQIDLATAIGCALIVPAILEIAMLPISIAGWGVREGVAIIAFGHLGVPAAISFATSVMFALILLTLGLIGGLSWLVDAHEMRGRPPLDVSDRPQQNPSMPPAPGL